MIHKKKAFALATLVFILLYIFFQSNFVTEVRKNLSRENLQYLNEDSVYVTLDNEIYYKEIDGTTGSVRYILMPEVDTNTFTPIQKTWAKDANHIYRLNEKAPYEPDSFKIISQNINGLLRYVSDETGVYFQNYNQSTFVSSSTDTFKKIEGTEKFWTDDSSVFLEGQLVIDADPSTFEVLNYYWAKDSDSVFSGIISTGPLYTIDNVDPDELKVFGKDIEYSIISDEVFYVSRKQEMNERLYTWKGRLVNGADSNSFKVEEGEINGVDYDAHDSYSYYKNGVRVLER